MWRAFLMPGILLPISVLLTGAYLGNSALDVQTHNFNNGSSLVAFVERSYALLLMVSWGFHIILGFIKRLSLRVAWLQAGMSFANIFFFYTRLPFGFAGMPRRYFDYGIYGIGWSN